MAIRTEPVTINLGPQHPSTHGVFRLRVTFDGEEVLDIEPVIGYMHRGTEKLAESRTYVQIITLTDRMDWLASMSNNLAYVRTVEKLGGIEVPERGMYLRVISAELQRIASHLMATGFLVNDLGAFATPLMYCFRERERILDMFEMLCGARLTLSYMRPGGVLQDAPEEFWIALDIFLRDMPEYIDDLEGLITNNEIVLARTRNVGILSAEQAINASITGPMLRASGVQWDIRKADPYEIYDRLEFDIPIGAVGDTFDRYLVRIQEMRESLKIIDQALDKMPEGPINVDDPRVTIPPKDDVHNSIEGLIYHFKNFMFGHGIRPPKGEIYSATETPNGELGWYLISDGTERPWRWRVRSPSFYNYQPIPQMCQGALLSDVVAVLGALNVIAGELDR